MPREAQRARTRDLLTSHRLGTERCNERSVEQPIAIRQTRTSPSSFMLLSKSCEYGLRAMLYLSSRTDPDTSSDSGRPSAPVHTYISIETIGEELSIGLSYLTKVCQQLNDAGLLTSKRGRGGGIALTRAPTEIALYDIVVAIDGDDLFEECVLGLPGCGEAEPCPLHEHWTEERERMRSTFRNTTLAEVPNVRLTPFVGADSDLTGDTSP